MSDIKGPPADLTFTMTITRKATGKVETYNMEGFVLPEQQPEPQPEGDSKCPQP